MRILLMHQSPLAQSEAGRLVEQWSLGLAAAGHEARLLVVDDRAGDDGSRGVERIVCRDGDANADLPFDVPRFGAADAHRRLTFRAMSDQQLAQYRERLRRRLDLLVDRFDPHVIHAQHIWVQAQLGLETGVPYVLNAWDDELIDYRADARFQGLANQAAENASRILVPDEAMSRRVARLFETAGERMHVMSADLMLRDSADPASARVEAAGRLVTIYQKILDERFGNHS
jgi:hypothetical protein